MEVPEDDLARIPKWPLHVFRRQRGVAVVPELDGQLAAGAPELGDGQQRIHRVRVRVHACAVAQPSDSEHALAAASVRPALGQAVHDGPPLGALLDHLPLEAALRGLGCFGSSCGGGSTVAFSPLTSHVKEPLPQPFVLHCRSLDETLQKILSTLLDLVQQVQCPLCLWRLVDIAENVPAHVCFAILASTLTLVFVPEDLPTDAQPTGRDPSLRPHRGIDQILALFQHDLPCLGGREAGEHVGGHAEAREVLDGAPPETVAVRELVVRPVCEERLISNHGIVLQHRVAAEGVAFEVSRNNQTTCYNVVCSHEKPSEQE
mmetsp:Transcript_80125/g.258989  ORF Transcript_80125/g.258989 Transcript_80125/m.258989 type:complete len:318 (+) Transcript_80125:265-1218(+)